MSSLLMLLAPAVGWVIAAQALAGASAAVIVPALVALIAESYVGDQRATAIGSLGSARALAGVAAFLLGGVLGTLVGWRPVFGVATTSGRRWSRGPTPTRRRSTRRWRSTSRSGWTRCGWGCWCSPA